MGTSTNFPNDRAPITNKQGTHLVEMATEETIIYEVSAWLTTDIQQ